MQYYFVILLTVKKYCSHSCFKAKTHSFTLSAHVDIMFLIYFLLILDIKYLEKYFYF